jgi:hypothetical protein
MTPQFRSSSHQSGSTTTGSGNDLRIGENKSSPIEVSSFTLEGAPFSERAFSWSPHRSTYPRLIAASHDLPDAAAPQQQPSAAGMA